MTSVVRSLGSAALLLATALSVLLLASPSYAANGSLTIRQKSPINDFGDWTLLVPGGSTVTSTQQQDLRELPSTPEGTYTITVNPPRDAHTTINVLEGAAVLSSVNGTTHTFALPAGSAMTVSLEYSYRGTIRVESTPRGAPFELISGSARYTGTTPATFENLPPLQYSLHFGMMDNCSTPQPFKRALLANGELTFTGVYNCRTVQSSSRSSRSSSSMTARSSSSSDRAVSASASLWQSVSQREVLPGGSVNFTVGVQNRGKSTLHDVTVTEQFDPALLTIVEPIEWGGDVQGDVIVWTIPSIFAGQSWSASFTGKVPSTVATGTELSLSARATSKDLNGRTRDLVSTTTVGVATLPATGTGMEKLAVIVSLLAGMLCIRLQRKRQA